MKTRILLALPVLFLVACNSAENAPTIDTKPADSISQPSPAQAETVAEPIALKKKMLGTWIFVDELPMTLKIDEDSIHYPENLESYRYTLKDDSLVINYPEYYFAAKVRFIGDTLQLESTMNAAAKYYRQPNP